MTKALEYLNQNYPKNKRNEIIELDLSGWNDKDWKEKLDWEKLTGELDLSEFPNLKKLDCSYNQITLLNLTGCPKLTELKCWENKLMEIKFPCSPLKLKIFYAWTNNLTKIDWNIFSYKDLTHISISNNNLQDQDIGTFSKFTNLEEFLVGNDIVNRLEERKYNSFRGSLKTLKNLTKLKKIQIEGTGVEEDLKNLPKSLEVISWHKQNEMIARIIPLERLYVIRNNIQQFLKKWGKKEEHKWYELGYWNKQVKKEIVLSRLKNPNTFSKSWWIITGIQWTNRATLVAGGSLVFIGQSDTDNPHSQLYTQVGGVIAIAGPFVETLTSYLNDKIYETKQKQWDEFLTDVDTFLENYHELLGILSQFEKSNKLKGTVNKSIRNLSRRIEEFLKIYDVDSNHEIDIEELKSKQNELTQDLSKEKSSEMQGIINEIKNLEKAIIEYRKFSYYEETLVKENATQETNNENKKDESQSTIDLDKCFEDKEQLETKIEVNLCQNK